MSKAPATNRFHGVVVAFTVASAIFCLGGAACARADASRCDQGDSVAAARNGASLSSLAWAPFGRLEIGWAIYQPLIAHEIGSTCSVASSGFAARLAGWQRAHGLAATGVMDMASFARFKLVWQGRRPFVAASRAACPAPPAESSLARASPAESYGGKVIVLRPAALAAYRRMVAAARADMPAMNADRRLLTIFSAYRSPQYDDARCARQGNCQGITRATCSAHRTGLAIDVYLESAPGQMPDLSDDANRLAISRSSAYRWLVANAGRFGFVNYAFEPWHWEWVGEPP